MPIPVAPTPTRVTLTPEQIRAALQSGTYSLAGNQFTFSIPTVDSTWSNYSVEPDQGGHGNEPFRPGYALPSAQLAAAYRAMIGIWNGLIAPDFVEVADNATSRGELRIAFTDLTGELSGTYSGAWPGAPDSRAGDTWVNADYLYDPFTPGSYSYRTTSFALDQSLGLVRNYTNTGSLPSQYDTSRFTVASTHQPSDGVLTFSLDGAGNLTSSQTVVSPVTPMVLDIAAAQVIYGADPATAARDTVYRFTEGAPGLRSLYDAGGIDTISLSNFTRDSIVDLTPGGYSSLGIWSTAEQTAYWQALFPGHDAFIAQQVSSSAYQFRDNFGIALSTVIENAIGGAGDDIIYGNDVANRLDGGRGDDRVEAGAGDDRLIGGAGDDLMNGGEGIDTADYSRVTGPVSVALYLQDTTQFTRSAGEDTLSGIENLIGTAFDDELWGDAAANVLEGGGGNDRITGNAADTASYASAAAGVIVTLDANDGSSSGGAGQDSIYGVGNVLGSSFADTLSAAAFVSAGLFGATGDDVLVGGLNNDLLDGGAGRDLVSFARAFGGVTVSLAIRGAQDTVGAGTDTLVGIEDLSGSGAGDTLTGNRGANRVDGGSGNDRLIGGAGGDVLIGGAGRDLLNGGSGVDTADYAAETGAVRITLLDGGARTPGHGLGAGGDILIGIENLTGGGSADELTGNAIANQLAGGAGADALSGAGGDDILIGGQGQDQLTGGAGADHFVFAAGESSAQDARADRIVDFRHGEEDRIDLFAIDADTRTAGDQRFAFIGTAAFSRHAGELNYAVSAGSTYIRGDTDGDGRADFAIALTGTAALATSDFLLGSVAVAAPAEIVVEDHTWSCPDPFPHMLAILHCSLA